MRFFFTSKQTTHFTNTKNTSDFKKRPDHFVPNLILYKTVRIQIRDYFALVTSFKFKFKLKLKLKKSPYRNVGLR